ncbi:TetR/AcrR family transcriptional regulator [Micrococcoides hystricis]|uniref:TetR/AcrR family transcriptional regulator n=1 Tax=Micrococcoides hystricis TaxID=1572761 RepID=A0ABV6P6L1_9MICC
MPLIVDHVQRRAELVEVTWRVIAQFGFERATMRQICAAAGYANGALKPYFPTKEDLLEATFEYVFERTTTRIHEEVGDSTGREALEAFAEQVLPLDELRQDEARVVIPFWQRALHNEEEQAVNREKMSSWQKMLHGWFMDEGLAEETAVSAGHTFLTFLLGTQVTTALNQEGTEEQTLREHTRFMLDVLLRTGKA